MKSGFYKIAAPVLLLIVSGFSKIASLNSLPAKVICIYRTTSRTDSTSKTTRTELTQLSISDSLSEYRSVNRYKFDSIAIKYQNASVNSPAFNEGMNATKNVPRQIFDGIIIKNLKTNTCQYYGVINRVLYSYQDNNYPMTWQATQDTASINGYKCQKAFTKFGGRKYTAWFTRQIPISNGPYKFGNLPGLIVLVSDATESYKYELIHIYKPTTNYIISLPNQVIFPKKSAIITSKQKYYDSYFSYQKNFIDNFLARGGIQFNNEEEIRKTHQERISHRNNPIELNYSN